MKFFEVLMKIHFLPHHVWSTSCAATNSLPFAARAMINLSHGQQRAAMSVEVTNVSGFRRTR
jgi:hypothetical protein